MHVLKMKAKTLQLICTVCVNLSSGLQGVQFHYAFWEISFISKQSKSQMSPHLPPISSQQYWLKLIAQLFSYYCSTQLNSTGHVTLMAKRDQKKGRKA